MKRKKSISIYVVVSIEYIAIQCCACFFSRLKKKQVKSKSLKNIDAGI